MILGIFSPTNSRHKRLYWIFWTPTIITCTFYLLVVDFISLIKMFKTDYKEAILNVAITSLHIISTIRIYFWLFHVHNKFETFISIINRKSFNFSVFNINKLHISENIIRKYGINVSVKHLQNLDLNKYHKNNIWYMIKILPRI